MKTDVRHDPKTYLTAMRKVVQARMRHGSDGAKASLSCQTLYRMHRLAKIATAKEKCMTLNVSLPTVLEARVARACCRRPIRVRQ